jgi:hypothetical protein
MSAERGLIRAASLPAITVAHSTKPFCETDEAGPKHTPAITTTSGEKVLKMIEVVMAILGLFCASIFLAHAVDAYRAFSAPGFGARRGQNDDNPRSAWSH